MIIKGMCGILCVVEGSNTITETDFENQLKKIAHRGPDCQIVKKVKNVHLGFQRLSITGVNEKTNIILNKDGVYLLCNGEIYNYQHLIEKFELKCDTDSDCEVILQLYLKFLDDLKIYRFTRTEGDTEQDYVLINRTYWEYLYSQLDGDFAVILYDSNKDVLFTFRDRVGVRPLFGGDTREVKFLEFASESKALSTKYGSQILPFTIGVYSTLFTDRGCLDTFPLGSFPKDIHRSYSSSYLFNLLETAVAKRLKADRPIGFLLSGGLDSSIIASLGSLYTGIITTFSIGYPESEDLKYARIMAKYLKSDHHEVIMTDEMVENALSKVIFHLESYDITTVRASIPMYLLAEYISKNTNVRVILSGEGADELFGGYLYFHNAPTKLDAQFDSLRLVQDLHHFDVLRADRMISAWGLELRVPFLDADFISHVLQIDPYLKFTKPEKLILREAFEDILPVEILRRRKEAFSDGVGSKSVQLLKKLGSEYKPKNIPFTKEILKQFKINTDPEPLMYYDIYWENFRNNIPYYWMPKWNDGVSDPSATVLKVYQE